MTALDAAIAAKTGGPVDIGQLKKDIAAAKKTMDAAYTAWENDDTNLAKKQAIKPTIDALVPLITQARAQEANDPSLTPVITSAIKALGTVLELIGAPAAKKDPIGWINGNPKAYNDLFIK
jgi:hypothetical protein